MVVLQEVKTVSCDNANVDKNFEYLRRLSGELADIPILQGRLIEDQVLTGGTDMTIFHLLGRRLKGWFPVRISADTRIFDKQSTNASPDETLVLRSVNTVTVSLWVF
jgi:hypothetical protein